MQLPRKTKSHRNLNIKDDLGKNNRGNKLSKTRFFLKTSPVIAVQYEEIWTQDSLAVKILRFTLKIFDIFDILKTSSDDQRDVLGCIWKVEEHRLTCLEALYRWKTTQVHFTCLFKSKKQPSSRWQKWQIVVHNIEGLASLICWSMSQMIIDVWGTINIKF